MDFRGWGFQDLGCLVFRMLKVFTVGFLEILGLRVCRVVCFRVLIFWCLGFWGFAW